MVSSNFFYDSRVRALTKFNENYAFVMLVIFSLMPFLAMFSPQSFGPLFTGIAQLEIWSLLILGAFQLISYASFSSRSYPTNVRMKLCFLKAWDSLKNNKAGLLFIGFYVLSIISAFFAKDPERAYLGTEFRPDGIRMYTAFAVIFVYASLVKSKVLKNRIILINLICFIPVSLIVVQQYFGIIGTAGVKDAGKIGEFLMGVYNNWGIRTGHFYKGMTGSFYNLNHVGYYIVVCSMLISGKLFFAKTLKAKIIWGIFALYSYYVMIVNDTFGGYLAILITLIIMPIFVLIKTKAKNKNDILRAFLPLVIFALLNLVFVAADPQGNPIKRNFNVFGNDVEKIATTDNIREEEAGSGRLSIWVATVDMIKEKPLLGYGPDNLKPHYVDREVTLDRAHNEPIERAVATGIPSAIFYYAAIGYALFTFIKSKKTWQCEQRFSSMMATVGYLVSSLVGVFLFYTGGFFFLLLGFSTSFDEMENMDITDAKSTKKK